MQVRIKILLDQEDQILKVKICKLEKPYLWYKDRIGQELQVIDKRYENIYHVPHLGYISKSCCQIIGVVIPRQVPAFPFKVKILKNSWFPQCWYANRIGEDFTITSGFISNNWYTTHPNGNPAWILKNDCQIL